MPFCHARLSARKPETRPYPKTIETLGDRIRTRRLDLGLLQRDVADRLAASEASVWEWENNRTEPQIRFMPAILIFLGQNPHPRPASFPEWLTLGRRELGFSRRRMAAELGIDESTLFRWEHDRGRPQERFWDRLRALLGQPPP